MGGLAVQGGRGDHENEDLEAPTFDPSVEMGAAVQIRVAEWESDVGQIWVPYSMEVVGWTDGCSQRSAALSHVTPWLRPHSSAATGGCSQMIQNACCFDLPPRHDPWTTFDLPCPLQLLPWQRSVPSGTVGGLGGCPCHHDVSHLCTGLGKKLSHIQWHLDTKPQNVHLVPSLPRGRHSDRVREEEEEEEPRRHGDDGKAGTMAWVWTSAAGPMGAGHLGQMNPAPREVAEDHQILYTNKTSH